jgi:hypothetical protein
MIIERGAGAVDGGGSLRIPAGALVAHILHAHGFADGLCHHGRIHGRVIGLGEKTLTIEIAPKVPVQVDRDAIQRVLTIPDETREKERDKS